MNRTRSFTLCILALIFAAAFVPFQAASAAGTAQTYEITAPILSASDDMEEYVSDGSLHFGSTHLELGVERPDDKDNTQAQLVCLRFDQLPVPAGAVIESAYIQFTTYGSNSSTDGFSLTIAAEDTADSAPLPAGEGDDTAYAISSRALTEGILWQTDEDNRILWHTESRATENQRTPDLTALVQEIVDKDGWAYGNALSMIIQGSGNRVAYSYDKVPDKAAVLHVTFSIVPLSQAAPEGLTTTAVTNNLEDYDGSILGTTTDMEYKMAGSDTWKSCTDGSVTGLADGKYFVRYAEKPGYLTGDAATVSVGQYVFDISLQPGGNETEMSFTWYCRYRSDQQSIVQLAPKAAMTGDDFPAEAAQTFYGENYYTNQCLTNSVPVTGLEPNTEYVYRVGCGDSYSQPYYFATHDPYNYSFILAGDPQIGSSGSERHDEKGWNDTLATAIATYPDTSFILDVGDHVATESCEYQYNAFFTPPILTSMLYVPTIGNHDVWSSYANHFTTPNESDEYGLSMAGGDYWFTYGNTLFINLNTNAFAIAAHDAFIGEAIAAAGDNIVWRILVFHHSIYSSGSHSQEALILSWRKYLYPIIDSYDIDVALMGHDHCYTRTYQMLGGVEQSGNEAVVTNPIGTLYVTANSASGSKYYDLNNWDLAYSAVHWQGYEPSYSNIAITDTSFSLTTLLAGDNTVIDQYTIIKDPTLDTEGNEATAEEAAATEEDIATEGDTAEEAAAE